MKKKLNPIVFCCLIGGAMALGCSSNSGSSSSGSLSNSGGGSVDSQVYDLVDQLRNTTPVEDPLIYVAPSAKNQAAEKKLIALGKDALSPLREIMSKLKKEQQEEYQKHRKMANRLPGGSRLADLQTPHAKNWSVVSRLLGQLTMIRRTLEQQSRINSSEKVSHT